MYNSDPYNIFLAIATNIPVLLCAPGTHILRDKSIYDYCDWPSQVYLFSRRGRRCAAGFFPAVFFPAVFYS